MTDTPDDAERLLSILEPAGQEVVAPGMRLCHPSEARIIYGFPPLRRDGKPFCAAPTGFAIFTTDTAGVDAWSREAQKVAEAQRLEYAKTHGADGSDDSEPPPFSAPRLVRS
ncbi:MAG: hypothetical protein ACLQJR_09160 [Stellaceae bacterium]